MVLSDTPGILWPKFENEHSGYRLAASGAVKDTAMEYVDVATVALGYLLSAYPKELSERFRFNELPASPSLALEQIAAKRGCLKPGGIADLHKAAELCLHELRAGKIGRIGHLETPALVEQELAEIEAKRQAEWEAKKPPRRLKAAQSSGRSE